MVKNVKRTSMEVPTDLYWLAKKFGIENRIDGGFKGVVVVALEELLSVDYDLTLVSPHSGEGKEGVGSPEVKKEVKK